MCECFLNSSNLKGLQPLRFMELHNLQGVVIIWVMSHSFLGVLGFHLRPLGYNITCYSSSYVIIAFEVVSNMLGTIDEAYFKTFLGLILVLLLIHLAKTT